MVFGNAKGVLFIKVSSFQPFLESHNNMYTYMYSVHVHVLTMYMYMYIYMLYIYAYHSLQSQRSL